MAKLGELIKEANDFYSLKGADTEKITEAEEQLRLKLAPEFTEYALEFGAATFDGHELTGVCNSERLSVVSATERARQFYPNFPNNMYVVEEMLIDHILIVQDSEGTVYSYGPDDEAVFIANSLQEYLFKVSE